MKSGFARVFVVAALTTVLAASLAADHSWQHYHWARTTSSFTLTVVNSTTDEWDPYVDRAAGDWSRRSPGTRADGRQAH